jgi:hypothetical protein
MDRVTEERSPDMPLLTDDGETQVAFSIFHNKGVYAALLGSGVSSATGIPTGWEITLDLIRRVGLARGSPEQPDWAKWYREQTKLEPEYSAVVEELGLSSAERRSILDGYIEPTEKDRTLRRKTPTKAPAALAELVRSGYIRLIVTTNFDRLMENALREREIEPTIIASVDALSGAPPLAHSRCYLVKLHGDYKDARILNTDSELKKYPKPLDKLLDRIFDEYGLIVVGWSAQWDDALRSAFERAPNRRYPTFWTARGPLNSSAADLVAHRKARIVTIKDANSFLDGLQKKIEILIRSQVVDPPSIKLLVNSAKRYVDEKRKMDLSDLLETQCEKLRATAKPVDMMLDGSVDPKRFIERLELYEAASEPLGRIAGIVGRWGDDSELPFVLDVVQALLSDIDDSLAGFTVLVELRSYPALLVFTSYGIGLTRANRWGALHKLFSFEFRSGISNRQGIDLFSSGYFRGYSEIWKRLGPLQNPYTPVSDRLCDLMAEWGKSFIGLTPDVELLFERYELLGSIAYFERYPEADIEKTHSSAENNYRIVRVPVGRFIWDNARRTQLFEEFKKPEYKNGVFGAGFAKRSEKLLQFFIKNVDYMRNASGMI